MRRCGTIDHARTPASKVDRQRGTSEGSAPADAVDLPDKPQSQVVAAPEQIAALVVPADKDVVKGGPLKRKPEADKV